MSNWVGYAVSVNCGEPLGCYQGTILEADGTTITLTKAFRNGFPYPKSQVTLNAADIKDLRIIEQARSECTAKTHSTVAVTKTNKKTHRATVCENLQANNSSSGNQHSVTNSNTNMKMATIRNIGSTPVRSKPIDIQGPRNGKNNAHSGSGGAAGGSAGAGAGLTPKARGERARRRNEACFGDAAESALLDDFDFEGNLALFDKQALWEEMRAAARPDVVRAADEAARCFRHDENVLGAAEPDGIWVPEQWRAGRPLRAPDGRRVPAVSDAARRLLWDGIERSGAAVAAAATVLLARAAADVALRLAGGGRRLEPRNAHQAPVAVCVAGAHRPGAAAVSAARLLASHGVRAHVLLADEPAELARCAPLQAELAALALSGAPAVRRPSLLPSSPDIVILAVHDPCGHTADDQEREKYAEALEWARGVRGAVLVLEPGGAEGEEGAARRCAVHGALPGAWTGGQQFLADVAPPPGVFRALGIVYHPPFGASSVVALQ